MPVKRKRGALGAPEEKLLEVGPGVEVPPTPDQQSAENNDKNQETGRKTGQALTDYEKEREERLRLNRERMMKLNLPSLATTLTTVAQKSANPSKHQKGVTSRSRKEKEQMEPRITRRSLRVQGVLPDGSMANGIDLERRDGTVVLASGGIVRHGSDYKIEEAKKTAEAKVGNLDIESINCSADTDAAFADSLEKVVLAGNSGLPAQGNKVELQPLNLNLQEEDVAKVVKNGAAHMCWLPSTSKFVVATGDKNGHIGLWDVDFANDAEKVEGSWDEAFDGVLLCKPHDQYISGLKWTQEGRSGLYSCSYDGSLRLLDLEQRKFLEVYRAEADSYSAFSVNQSRQCVYLGDNRGGFTIVDLRSGKKVTSKTDLHEKKVNSVDVEPLNETYVATTSSGGAEIVSIWDSRKISKGKPLLVLPHSRACHSAYFSPAGTGEVLTTCFDNHLRVWEDVSRAKATLSNQIYHNNNTGRWVLPFRAIWSVDGSTILCGSMKRELEFFDAKTGSLAVSHASEYMTAIPSRSSVHPFVPVVAAGTSSGRVHIFR
mmetsp:Transcript_1685/g.10337  ORF Transcript_1685/g.10337 Transcript_1685/m.10337 type:complete len:544 (+) Transcript_1685:492-2123(+)